MEFADQQAFIAQWKSTPKNLSISIKKKTLQYPNTLLLCKQNTPRHENLPRVSLKVVQGQPSRQALLPCPSSPLSWASGMFISTLNVRQSPKFGIFHHHHHHHHHHHIIIIIIINNNNNICSKMKILRNNLPTMSVSTNRVFLAVVSASSFYLRHSLQKIKWHKVSTKYRKMSQKPSKTYKMSHLLPAPRAFQRHVQ